MFTRSSSSKAWDNFLVVCISKPVSRSFNPITLISTFCKLFKYLVQHRIDIRAETKNWIPWFKFGFRRSMSAMDCSAMVSTRTDIREIDLRKIVQGHAVWSVLQGDGFQNSSILTTGNFRTVFLQVLGHPNMPTNYSWLLCRNPLGSLWIFSEKLLMLWLVICDNEIFCRATMMSPGFPMSNVWRLTNKSARDAFWLDFRIWWDKLGGISSFGRVSCDPTETSWGMEDSFLGLSLAS